MLSACNLNDSLVPKRLEDSGSEFTASSAMSNSALETWPVRKHVSITSQVQGVVSAALDKHQVTHIVMLLLSPWGSPSELVLLFSLLVAIHAWPLALLLVLGCLKHLLLVSIFKCKHLWGLVVIEHLVVGFQLVGHLSVHFRGVLMRVLNVVVFPRSVLLVLRVHLWLVVKVRPLLVFTHVPVGRSVTKTVSCCVSALHSIWSLGSVSRMSKRLSFFNTLINLLSVRSNSLLELIEVLLLLVKCWLIEVSISSTSWCNWLLVLLVAISVLILASDHLSTSFSSSFLLRGEPRIKSFIFVINWV